MKHIADTGKHSNLCESTTVTVMYEAGTRCNAGRHIKPNPDGSIRGNELNVVPDLVQGQQGLADKSN